MKPVHHTSHHHQDNGLSIRSQDPSSSSEDIKTPENNHHIAMHHKGAKHEHANGKEDSNTSKTHHGEHAKYHDATPNPKADAFAIFAIIFQVAMILVYSFLVEYDDPQDALLEPDGHNVTARYYPFYTDIAVMMFIGMRRAFLLRLTRD
jgi:hypothetical protein